MNATNRYLDQLAKALGGASDYRLAKALGKGTSAISHYRNGRSSFDVKTCFQVAALLKIEPAEVIAAVEGDRAKSDQDRAFWMRYAGKAAAMLAAVICSALLQVPMSGNADASTASDRGGRLTEIYILHWLRWLAWLVGPFGLFRRARLFS